jgi:hypothetical protein
MRLEPRREVEQVLLHSSGNFNFDINLGRATFGEILALNFTSLTLIYFKELNPCLKEYVILLH